MLGQSAERVDVQRWVALGWVLFVAEVAGSFILRYATSSDGFSYGLSWTVQGGYLLSWYFAAFLLLTVRRDMHFAYSQILWGGLIGPITYSLELLYECALVVRGYMAAGYSAETIILATGNILVFQAYGVGFLALVVITQIFRVARRLGIGLRTSEPMQISEGERRAATEREMVAAGAFKGESFIGAAFGRRVGVPFSERLIIAASGRGKDASVCIPALLTEERPVIAFDMKAQMLAVSCERRTKMGGGDRVVQVLDPFGVSRQKGFVPQALLDADQVVYVTLNPFSDMPDRDAPEADRFIDAAVTGLCDLPKPTDDQSKQHFATLATKLMRAMLWGDVCDGLAPSPVSLRERLFELAEGQEEFVNKLLAYGHFGKDAGVALMSAGDRERGSIITTTGNYLDWLLDRNMVPNVSSTTLDMDLVRSGKSDLFIILPEDQVEKKRRWVMMVMAYVFRFFEGLPIAKRPRTEVLGLWNEIGQLGYCRPLEECWTRIRGRGVRNWPVFQNRGQMKVYANPAVFEDAAVVQAFGTQDGDTLKWLGELSGKRRVLRVNVQEGANAAVALGGRGGGSMSSGRTVQEAEVTTLTADVVRGLGTTRALLFMTGLAHPAIYDQVRYYLGKEFRDLWLQDPYELWRSQGDNEAGAA
jgi:type IV secretory pathway TraG/TraD family ATPase VirD4